MWGGGGGDNYVIYKVQVSRFKDKVGAPPESASSLLQLPLPKDSSPKIALPVSLSRRHSPLPRVGPSLCLSCVTDAVSPSQSLLLCLCHCLCMSVTLIIAVSRSIFCLCPSHCLYVCRCLCLSLVSHPVFGLYVSCSPSLPRVSLLSLCDLSLFLCSPGSPSSPRPSPLLSTHAHTGHKRKSRRWAGPTPGRGPAGSPGSPLPARHRLLRGSRAGPSRSPSPGAAGAAGGRQPKKGRRGLLPAGIPSSAYQLGAARSP